MKKFICYAMVIALFQTVGCGGDQRQNQHMALNTVTDIADPTYDEALEVCDTLRNHVVERQGTTWEQDRRAMDSIHNVCGMIVDGFEGLRGTQLTARTAIDAGLEAATREAIERGLQAWERLQTRVVPLVYNLATSGGEE